MHCRTLFNRQSDIQGTKKGKADLIGFPFLMNFQRLYPLYSPPVVDTINGRKRVTDYI